MIDNIDGCRYWYCLPLNFYRFDNLALITNDHVQYQLRIKSYHWTTISNDDDDTHWYTIMTHHYSPWFKHWPLLLTLYHRDWSLIDHYYYFAHDHCLYSRWGGEYLIVFMYHCYIYIYILLSFTTPKHTVTQWPGVSELKLLDFLALTELTVVVPRVLMVAVIAIVQGNFSPR